MGDGEREEVMMNEQRIAGDDPSEAGLGSLTSLTYHDDWVLIGVVDL